MQNLTEEVDLVTPASKVGFELLLRVHMCRTPPPQTSGCPEPWRFRPKWLRDNLDSYHCLDINSHAKLNRYGTSISSNIPQCLDAIVWSDFQCSVQGLGPGGCTGAGM